MAEKLGQHLRRAGLLSCPKAGRDESPDLRVKIWGFPSGLPGVVRYIFENPVRKEIVRDYAIYPYLGSCMIEDIGAM